MMVGPARTIQAAVVIVIALLYLLMPAAPARAVTSGGEVFLQGNYLEVGIHSSGSFGTSTAAPTGFHPINRTNLGFVSDPQKDGWLVGSPAQSGDYFLPGTPEEGWAVEWTTSGFERTFGNFGLVGPVNVPQTSLIENTVPGQPSATWTGEATNGSEKLRVEQTVHFSPEELFFIIDVVLTNTGTVSLDSVEYMRNVDPDQERDLAGGSYTTDNYVAYQPGPGNDKALVVARGITYGLPLGLGTIDPRAVVSTEGFSNRDPDAILDSPIAPSEASPLRADRAIALAYRFGTLAPGDSVSFQYAYILNAADLDKLNEILNQPPEITSLTAPASPFPIGAAVDVSAEFTDANTTDVHTAEWAWGDGTSSSGLVGELGGSGTVDGSHSYTRAGLYTLGLTVTDSKEAADSANYTYLLAYDPAGAALGKGALTSPAGAVTADPSLTGRATLGFSSRYPRGATAPAGFVSFGLPAARLSFTATSLDWLIANSTGAWIHGRGNLNGVPGYEFLLMGVDARAPGAAGKGRVRFYLRAPGAGPVVYDNMPGAPWDTVATGVLDSGRVTVKGS